MRPPARGPTTQALVSELRLISSSSQADSARDRAAPSGSTGAGAGRTAGSGDNSPDAGRSLGGLDGCVPNRRGLELHGPGRRSQLRQGRYGRFVPPADRVLGPLQVRGCTPPAKTPSGLARSLRHSGRVHGCCPDTGRRSLVAMRSRYPSSMCIPGHLATGGGRAQRMPPRLCRASTRLRAAPRTPLAQGGTASCSQNRATSSS